MATKATGAAACPKRLTLHERPWCPVAQAPQAPARVSPGNLGPRSWALERPLQAAAAASLENNFVKLEFSK